jgi:predicted transcriptional regulator
MTKLLDKALARVRSWSSDRQDDAARLLLAMDHRDAEPYKLTQRDEIDAALAEVERGELASEEEVAAVFKRFGV